MTIEPWFLLRTKRSAKTLPESAFTVQRMWSSKELGGGLLESTDLSGASSGTTSTSRDASRHHSMTIDLFAFSISTTSTNTTLRTSRSSTPHQKSKRPHLQDKDIRHCLLSFMSCFILQAEVVVKTEFLIVPNSFMWQTRISARNPRSKGAGATKWCRY